MNQIRRNILRGAAPSVMLSVALAAGLLRSSSATASSLSASLAANLKGLRTSQPVVSDEVHLKAPAIAVDGASFFIQFSTTLPEVDALMVFVDRNPQPLVAAFQITQDVLPEIEMRIKLAQTAQVIVVARSAGKFHQTARSVKVTTGGCGAGVN